MTAAVLSSSSLCRGAHLWFFFLFTSAFILLSVTVFVSSPLSQSLLSFWSVLLQFLSSLSPLFAPVLSSPFVADGVFCCQQCSSFSATSSWRCWWQGMAVAWTVVDLSSSSSLCFSSALFSSVSVLFFCFSQCCCRLGGQ